MSPWEKAGVLTAAAVLLVPTTPANAAGTNLAAGKTFTASSSVDAYQPAKAGDGDANSYWESSSNAFPQWLQVDLGAAAGVNQVVLKLPPATAWQTRTQTLAVTGSTDGSSFATLKASAGYTFNPASGNTVTIDLTATSARFVRVSITANTGWPAGQLSELEVYGSGGTEEPPPTGTDIARGKSIEASSSVQPYAAANANDGNTATYWEGGAYPADLTVKLGADATVQSIVVKLNPDAAWAQRTQTFAVLGRADSASTFTTVKSSATYTFNPASGNSVTIPVSATAADLRLSFSANSGAPGGQVAEFQVYGTTVPPVQTSDLVGSVSWTTGNSPTFSAVIRNEGTSASAGGAHGITLTVLNSAGSALTTLTGSYSGTLAAGASSPSIALGSWTGANGRYTVRLVIANDANELPARQANNTSERPLFIGIRGATMPYEMYEAEDGTAGGGAQVLSANRTVGDLAGEASGRRAVTLGATGAFVQWTTRANTNTLVARFSIPDGTTSSVSVYVDGQAVKQLPLTSKYAWLYGSASEPQNSGTGPRHIYDEANILLDSTVAAGRTIKLQKDGGNPGAITIDFINLEQVAPIANPNPATYVVPSGFDQSAVDAALNAARQDTSKAGVYLPPGDYPTTTRFQVYGRAIQVVGAGPWYTRFYTPQNSTETEAGFRADSSANGSTFKNFAFFGNFTIRRDGLGKVFDFNNVASMTIDNIWTEHQLCLFWGANVDNMVIKNNRIRNMFADGLNMTNGSTGNLIDNIDARATGDDSFALFSAIDSNNSPETGNTFQNLTSTLTWRAAGLAVYGGYGNTFRNIYIADTLVYAGVTIASIDFDIPMLGFEATPPTTFDNISIVRAGGHFWGSQTFPGLWIHSGDKTFRGIRISNVDIVDPTYSGIMFQTKYEGGRALEPVTDTVLTNVSISGAKKSGDAFDAKSGYGIWVNALPESGQGPAVGSATFTGLSLSNNWRDIENTTSTFTINRN